MADNFRQLCVADTVALILGLLDDQRLLDQVVQDGLLELGVVQGFGFHAPAQPVNFVAVSILADLNATDLGDIDLSAGVKIGVNSPQRKGNNDHYQDESGEDTLGFITDLGKHEVATLSRVCRGINSMREQKTKMKGRGFSLARDAFFSGGADGTRTRDPRRAGPVFYPTALPLPVSLVRAEGFEPPTFAL